LFLLFVIIIIKYEKNVKDKYELRQELLSILLPMLKERTDGGTHGFRVNNVQKNNIADIIVKIFL